MSLLSLSTMQRHGEKPAVHTHNRIRDPLILQPPELRLNLRGSLSPLACGAVTAARAETHSARADAWPPVQGKLPERAKRPTRVGN